LRTRDQCILPRLTRHLIYAGNHKLAHSYLDRTVAYYENQRRYSEAARLVEFAIANGLPEPQCIESYKNWLNLFLLTGRHDQSRRLALGLLNNPAIDVEERSELLEVLGRVNLSQGLTTEAIRSLRGVLTETNEHKNRALHQSALADLLISLSISGQSKAANEIGTTIKDLLDEDPCKDRKSVV